MSTTIADVNPVCVAGHLHSRIQTIKTGLEFMRSFGEAVDQGTDIFQKPVSLLGGSVVRAGEAYKGLQGMGGDLAVTADHTEEVLSTIHKLAGDFEDGKAGLGRDVAETAAHLGKAGYDPEIAAPLARFVHETIEAADRSELVLQGRPAHDVKGVLVHAEL